METVSVQFLDSLLILAQKLFITCINFSINYTGYEYLNTELILNWHPNCMLNRVLLKKILILFMCILLKWCKWRVNDCSHCRMMHLSLFGYNLSSSMIIWSMSTFVGSSEYKDEWEKKISFTFSLRSFAKTSLRCKEISGLFTRVYASSHFHFAFRLLRSNISCFSSTIKDTE